MASIRVPGGYLGDPLTGSLGGPLTGSPGGWLSGLLTVPRWSSYGFPEHDLGVPFSVSIGIAYVVSITVPGVPRWVLFTGSQGKSLTESPNSPHTGFSCMILLRDS